MTHRYTFLINPAAKSGHAADVWQELETYLDDEKIIFEKFESQAPGDITKYAQHFVQRQPTNNQDHLVVVGGDGTLNEALNGIRDTMTSKMVPLAYLPAGSGNDFARAYQLDTVPINRLKKIINLTQNSSLEPEFVDTGVYIDRQHQTKRYFVNNLGIGFDALTVNLTNHSYLKKRLNRLGWGKLSYFISIFKALSIQDTFPLEVTWQKQTEYLPHTYLMTLSNHPYIGGGVEIMADANPRDAKIDLIVIENTGSTLRLLYILKQMIVGKHYRLPEVHRYTAEQFDLKTGRLEYGHADGEELGTHTFDLSVTTQKQPFWL
ncbi:YegS/Rv2252/BmrU family lipid kinase [Weissella diestrammenae]|uniref:YegS/Rv2252/BmrU family lipid kinase n=1 Tax=Weissella diestrammenae TaxID=1162633 RepID=A0A7G9T5F6_9LACO|nr:YegS/Rv2252/BmrU family lipid kinase [Weissella diestrammenae]MCM0583190.1 YegS/Rv2252/BmrU family lipid kinase [Weissella diestrammenae]QNN75331.1 YegS/Rv2252/BmrU family lipid kinase [Weissella diestrammenae]